MDALQSALLGAAAAAALTAVTGNTNAQRARKEAIAMSIAETLPKPKVPKVYEMPQNVGILAIEPYFPSTYLEQSELESHNGASAGKYTIGLGQAQMSLCTDNEDPTSMGLTVLTSLLEKYDIKGSEIGRLEIGTETLTDKSKSLKTSLLRALGNPNVEGATNLNACYGGTAAFLNCVNYCTNPCNKGKKAICVIVDIAAYARGAARPTSGSGAVAVLVGEDSWLKFGEVKASWTEDVWDFYKADHEVEYPQVDGKVSQECYFRSLRGCYEGFRKEVSLKNSKAIVIHFIDPIQISPNPNNNNNLVSTVRGTHIETVRLLVAGVLGVSRPVQQARQKVIFEAAVLRRSGGPVVR